QVLQVPNAARFAAGNPHCQLTIRIDRPAAANQLLGRDQGIYMFSVGRGKDVKWRAVVDLLGEFDRGAITKDHVDSFLDLESRSDLAKNIHKVSRRGDGEFAGR